jgi:formylglycine-generating enzyme required for sulfatase activity
LPLSTVRLRPLSHEPPPDDDRWLPIELVSRPLLVRLRLPPHLAIIPGGPAQIGYDHGFPDEAPVHMIDIPTFAIGIYPVMNHDYAAFMADATASRPCYWRDAHLNQDNQPVVGVTRSAAQAYCSWLTSRMQMSGMLPTGQIVRLPTELEWEKAASWDPVLEQARRYPWGNQWDAARAVTAATGTGFPVRVAQHPGGASACGVQGMLGNVWEWTTSLYMSYPGAAQTFIEPNRFVIRGGSCALRPTHLRCSYRCHLSPNAWRYHLGFRIVVAAPLG